MKISDFDYYLPEGLVAQEPVTPRDNSKLMVVDRKRQKIEHRIFRHIVDFLHKGDLLVLNDAKVFPARLTGKKELTGGKVNLLLIEKENNTLWRCLIQGSGRIREGLKIAFGDGRLRGEIKAFQDGVWRVRFDHDGELTDILRKIGEVPLPPYIKTPTEVSKRRYQTIYAKREGAIAAPTAGFHFTKKLLKSIEEKGVSVAIITLLVGKGTFIPVKTETVEEHRMEEEYFELKKEQIDKINNQLKNRDRIIAVGTSTVRTLESAYKNGEIQPTAGKTSLFIYPGYKFRVVNTLITNFHLPKSTPLLLTCAFAGRELILKAYQEAIDKGYRFYSFGDAMLII